MEAQLQCDQQEAGWPSEPQDPLASTEAAAALLHFSF